MNMSGHLLLLSYLLFAFSSQSFAHGLSQQLSRLRDLDFAKQNLFKQNFMDSDVGESTYQQLINPQDESDTRTFSQRFFYSGSLASGPDAPVLLYVCGEATCDAGNLGGATASYARELKAHRITLEHRYYGYSQPFPTLTTANMQYLSTENALLDLKNFQLWAQKTLKLTGPWIVIGGSYPGSLAAYYRFKFPELVVGALASSGPVQAKENFEEYDATVTRAAGPACAAKMREAVSTIEASLDKPEELARIKGLFGASDVIDPVDFLYVVADMGAIAIQYGYQESFCNKLINGGPDVVASYGQVGSQLFEMFGLTAVMDSSQGAMSEDPNDYLSPWGIRQWLYQSCTEYGYWQVAHSDPALRVRSGLIDLKYHHNLCAKVFGIPVPVQPEKKNLAFYEPIRNPGVASNIYFVNGGNDPWSTLSITTERANSLNPAIDLFTIPGASHCEDLGAPSSSDSAGLKQSRAFASKKFTQWLNRY
jgi:pimeloyl-ACP methyl ester carboxylesterase